MADNVLSAELELSEGNAFETARAFQQILEQTSTRINALGAGDALGRGLSNQFQTAQGRAALLGQTINQVLSNTGRSNVFEPFARQARSAQIEASRIQNELREINTALGKTNNKNLISELSANADRATARLKVLEAQTERLQQVSNRSGRVDGVPGGKNASGGGSNGGLDDVAGLFGFNLTGLTGAAGILGGGILGGRAVVNARADNIDSLRVLDSTAKEAGLNKELLRQQEQDFARRNALDNTQGNKTFAGITSFANQAGQTERINEFSKAFSDLAAARGIKSSELGDLSKQLGTLQDEATDKLFGKNPSAFYDAYAKSLGKTADALTDAEKRAALFNAVIEKGQLFNGEAEKRLDTLPGKLERINAGLKDFAIFAGKAVEPFVNSRLDQAFVFFEAATAGKGYDEIIKERRDKNTARIKAETEDSVNGILELEKKVNEARSKPTASLEAYALNEAAKKNSFRGSVIGNGLGNATEVLAERQQIVKKAIEDAQAYADGLKKAYDEISKDPRTSVANLLIARNDFQKQSFLFSQDDKVKLEKQLQEAINKQGALELQVKLEPLLGENQTVASIQKAKEILKKDGGLLSEEDAKKFGKTIDDALASVSKTLRALKSEVRGVLEGAGEKDNPFVRLFSNMETASDRARQKFGAFGKDFAEQMANVEKASLRAEIAQARFQSQLSALKLNQEAVRLANTPLGLTTLQSLQNDTLGARVANLTDGAEAGREAARLRSLNNPFAGTGNPEFSARRNPLSEILADVKNLKLLSSNNLAGRGVIADAILGRVRSLDPKILNNSQDPRVRELREFGAQSLGVKQETFEQQIKDAVGRENVQELIQKQSREQLGLLNNFKDPGFSDKDRLSQFLALTSQTPFQDLSPDLQAGRIKGLQQQSKFERERETRAEELSKKQTAFFEKFERILTEKGVRVDAGAALAQIEITSKDLSVQNGLLRRPGQSDVINNY